MILQEYLPSAQDTHEYRQGIADSSRACGV